MKVKQVKMSVKEWIEMKGNPQQRNTEFHAKKAVKNHLQEFSETHSRVAAAELPNGTRYKLDGHTRALLWEEGTLQPPRSLSCDIYMVENIKQATELYEHFDNSTAVETSGDKVAGAFRLFQIPRTARVWTSGGVTTALKTIYTNVHKGISKVDIKLCVKPFAQALKFIDNAGYHHPNFPAPVMAALILTVHKDGNAALSFWDAYNLDEGRKTVHNMDAVFAMTDQIRHLRETGEFMRGSRRAVFKHVPRMLAIYEQWTLGSSTKSKLFAKTPNAAGDFRYYIEIYCKDVMKDLEWSYDKRKKPDQKQMNLLKK